MIALNGDEGVDKALEQTLNILIAQEV